MDFSTGQCRRSNGEIFYFEYHGVTDAVCPRLYRSERELRDQANSDTSAKCVCRLPIEAVRLATNHRDGQHWLGLACFRCMVIVDNGDRISEMPRWWKRWKVAGE